MALQDLLIASAREFPDRPAVAEPSGDQLSYAELDALTDRIRDRLVAAGVERGDRVGFCLHKSIDSIATLFGVLKSGAAYVPVDPTAPPSRNGYIFANCRVKVLVTEVAMQDGLAEEMRRHGHEPLVIAISEVGGGRGIDAAVDASPTAATVTSVPDDLATFSIPRVRPGAPRAL